ncbi:hypothetical protein R1sor_007780 [Riccia sorocarpa]|uniref:protein-disulfide reductase n=1 Tax=Riccia sorocarpa TaxID=122646 RepID=A0ABD3HXR6_9MARC
MPSAEHLSMSSSRIVIAILTMEKEAETGAGSNLPLKDLLFPGGDGDLVDSEGAKVDNSVIEGKTLGILVGPAWWKPLMLTHVIPSFADAIKEMIDQGKPLKIIYVPLKRDEELIEQLTDNGRGSEIDTTPDEESFSSFIKSLPSGWLAVPGGNTAAIDKLTEVTYSRVVGLAFVGADGKVITTDGREVLMEWGAEAFPFTEEHLKELEKPFIALKENPSLKGLLETEERDHVIKNDGTQVKVSSLRGPIGIYFSAHWCPPCRNFTPILAKVYKQLKDEGKHFEIVFVSWDRSAEDFKEYFGQMPWLAIPFGDKGKKALEKVYSVEGIPNLVILDSDGKVQQDDAVAVISEFKAEAYPFTNEKVEELQAKAEAEKEALLANQTLESLLATEERDYVVDHENNEVKVSSLVGKTVGLYFSAHWCPPCRSFTPKLVQIYNELKEQGKPFEIIFISSDRDEEAFTTYYSEMPWLALPYNDRNNNVNTKQKLGEYFKVKGIPCLIILGPDGKTVNQEGRYTVEKFGAKAFPFVKKEEENLLKKWDDDVQKRPVEVTIPDHEHPLRLMRVPYKTESYHCDICNASASRWAYRCDDCGYDVEVKCIDKILAETQAESATPKAEDSEVKAESTAAPEDAEQTTKAEDAGANGNAHGQGKEGWICEGDVCRKE